MALARFASLAHRRPVVMLRRFSSSLPDHEFLPLPSLSPTMDTGSISRWLKGEGDFIEAGDVVCEIETDKAVVDFEATDSGYLAKILQQEGASDLKVTTPIAVLVEEEEDVAAFSSYILPAEDNRTSNMKIGNTTNAEAILPIAAQSTEPIRTLEQRQLYYINHSNRRSGIRFTHGVRLDSSQLDESKVFAKATPTPQAQNVPAPVAASTTESESLQKDRGYTDLPVSQMRRVIAARLTESKADIPHFYATAECRIDELLAIRAKNNKRGSKASVNDYVIRAAALALRDVPAANVSFDVAADKAVANPGIDVSVAVATDGGLITPIVKDADIKTPTSIGADVRELAGRAREGKLKPEEFMGGSFTISNLGMFGMGDFTAVINPPQSCILAVSSGSSKIVPNKYPVSAEETAKKCLDLVNSGEFSESALEDVIREGHTGVEVETTMKVSLSADARAVEPAVAAQFLQVFQEYIETSMHL
eukprot:g5017.t1